MSVTLIFQMNYWTQWKKRLKNYLTVPQIDLKMYEDVTTITYKSFPIYQVHTVDPMLICVDTGALHSCIGDKAIERIVLHSDVNLSL